MKISTRGKYSVNAMAELAKHYGKGPVCTKLISERQNIPDPYLEQLLGQLRKAGLVYSIRGVQGGYQLSRSPEQITVGDILYAIEGHMAPSDCVVENNREKCSCNCCGKLVWKRIYDSVRDVIDHMTLADLLEEYDKTGG